MRARLPGAAGVPAENRELYVQRRIVREAKGRAELLIAAAQNRLDDVQREIDGLKMKRREVEVGIEAIIGVLNHTLEFVREQPRDARLVPHQPRMQAAS